MQISKLPTVKPLQASFMGVMAAIIAIIISALLQPASVSLAAVTAGYITFNYGPDVTSEPTGEKPESKLWFNDGLWWGSLFNANDETYHIYQFNRNSQNWIDTGVQIDDRNRSKADVLWDQASQKLYVASHVFTRSATSSGIAPSNWGRLYRYSYNASSKTYTLDTGYPVNITQGISETLTIAKDSTGRLWVTYVEASEVMVNHSLANDATWTTPYVLPVASTQVSSDDISSIIAFQGNKTGIVWSNQAISGTGMFMAVHLDSAADNQWQVETIVSGGKLGDDHINLKTDSTGRLFVASKTSLTSSSDPLIVLHVRTAGGTWTMYTVTTHTQHQTRPIVMLHESGNKVYVFATSDNDGDILFKSSAIDNISFASGMGTVFIEDTSSRHLNNASSTKQNVTSAMGMLVIADNDVNNFYYHNDALEGNGNPPISLVASATCIGNNLQITVTAGDAPFDIVASSAPPGSSQFDDVPVGVYVSNGPGTWTNVRVIEQSGDLQTLVLGDFTCSTATVTPVPPTNTPVPPTDTPKPPTNTPVSNVALVASAQCVGLNLEITISAGDANFNILANTSPSSSPPYFNVPLGTYTSNGPGTWTNVRVVELSGDNEVKVLGDFTCTAVTDTPVPPTDTPNPVVEGLVVGSSCLGANLNITISAGDGPFNITASAGVNMPVLGVGIGTTTINGPEKWDNVTVTETSDDFESINLGQLRCRSDERPVPLTPAHRSRTTNPFPLFSWTSISNANNYRVFVFDDADPTQRTVDIRQNSGGPTNMMLTAPLPNGRLFWRARGRQNRIWSLWSIRFTLFKDPIVPMSVGTPVPTIDPGPVPDEGSTPIPVPTFPSPPNSR